MVKVLKKEKKEKVINLLIIFIVLFFICGCKLNFFKKIFNTILGRSETFVNQLGGAGRYHKLTDSDNLESVINKHSGNECTIVAVTAEWCGHCKALKPEYAAAADILKDSNPNVIVAKIDATANEKIAQRYEVQGYPTFKFFKNGTASDFHGGRDVQSIVNYVKTNLRPTLTIIDDMDVMDNFLSQEYINHNF